MIAHLEARSPDLPTEATPERTSQPDRPAADASPDRARDALPRCCEGWIAEQLHAWAQS